MPSERSSASAITGLKALRTNARSISLQTCIRPFCRTERVMGSTTMCHCASSNRHDQIPDRIHLDAIAGLDHRRAVELLDDRRPVEAGAGRQMLANVDRRRMEGVVEPDRPGGPLRLLERRLRPTG